MSSPSTTQNVLVTAGTLDATVVTTEIRLADGRVVYLPTASLLGVEPEAQFEGGRRRVDDAPETDVISLVEERLITGKRVVETGKLRLHKKVQEYETALDETLAFRTYDIERVQINKPVDAAPAIREENGVTVYPVVEEQLVVTRQLVLREEIRVTRRDDERRDTRPVTLRREFIEVEREQLDPVGQDVRS